MIWKTYSSIASSHYDRVNVIKESVYRKILQKIIKNPIYIPSINRRNKSLLFNEYHFLNVWLAENDKQTNNISLLYDYYNLSEALKMICKISKLYYRIYKFENHYIVIFKSINSHHIKMLGIINKKL